LASRKTAHLPAIGDHRGAQAVFLQVIADQLADLAVVVDDENVIDMFHRFKPLSEGECRAVYSAVNHTPACLCIAVYLGE
jgi:hypothetical protein